MIIVLEGIERTIKTSMKLSQLKLWMDIYHPGKCLKSVSQNN